MIPQRKPMTRLSSNTLNCIKPSRLAKNESAFGAFRQSQRVNLNKEELKNVGDSDKENRCHCGCKNDLYMRKSCSTTSLRPLLTNNIDAYEQLQLEEEKCLKNLKSKLCSATLISRVLPVSESNRKLKTSRNSSISSESNESMSIGGSSQKKTSSFLDETANSTLLESQDGSSQSSNSDRVQFDDTGILNEYFADILSCLIKSEKKYQPKHVYMQKQNEIDSTMRTKLVDWLFEVRDEYKLQKETLYLAVSYVDRFLSTMFVSRSKLQLLGKFILKCCTCITSLLVD